MVSYSDLTTVNATLNGTSSVLLITGYFFIRQKKIRPHKACMIAASMVSILFLISYVTYHYHARSTSQF